jgi:hypothetical protein
LKVALRRPFHSSIAVELATALSISAPPVIDHDRTVVEVSPEDMHHEESTRKKLSDVRHHTNSRFYTLSTVLVLFDTIL